MRIVEGIHMVDSIDDWSRVRSPSRAARRLRQGHRQNIVRRQVPKKTAISFDGGITFYVHPDVAAEIRRHAQPAAGPLAIVYA